MDEAAGRTWAARLAELYPEPVRKYVLLATAAAALILVRARATHQGGGGGAAALTHPAAVRRSPDAR